MTDWPTAPAVEGAVRFAGATGAGWTALGVAAEGPRTTTARWAGGVPGEGLVVSMLTEASADADLAGWLDVPMALGGLDPQTVPVPGEGAVLGWGEGPALVAAPDVDEQLARSGMLRFTAVGEERPELLHCYVLLARRGDVAWKVAVTLASAVPPDAPDDVVERNDHARARALFDAVALG